MRTRLSVNAHDTAVPLLRHAPTHLELVPDCSPVIRVRRGGWITNTRPKASITNQSNDSRGGPADYILALGFTMRS